MRRPTLSSSVPAKPPRLLCYQPDCPTSVPGLLRPTRFVAHSYTLYAKDSRRLALADTLFLQAYARRGQAVSLSMAGNTELPCGETTATSNNHEKKPLKSPGRPSSPLPQPTTRIKHNITVPTRRLDSSSILSPILHTQSTQRA